MIKKLFLLLILTGCGFSPLYSSKSMDERATMIDVAPIDGALGQDLRNNLEHRFNPSGINNEKSYKLVITLQEKEVSELGIRSDDTATRITISLTAYYTLYYKGKQVLKDKSTFLSAYNILQDPYSSYVSHQNALKEINDLISDDIAIRISLYLKDNSWQK